MGLPPLHRVDHRPTYILSFDTAWDFERINTEVLAIKDPSAKSPWPTIEDHPYRRYVVGESRADLSTVAAWLLPDPPSPPIKFVFRRLNLREMAMIEARQSTSMPAARNLALSYGLESVEDGGIEFTRGGREPPHALVDEDMERLRKLVGDAGIHELGTQAIACSRELLEVEKKP